MRTNLALALFCVVLMGCQSLYRGTVTITSVVDSASRQYAELYHAGLVSPEVATKAANYHANYQKAAGVAHDALVAAKLDPSVDTRGALEAVRTAASQFVDILVPLLTKPRAAELRADLKEARNL